MIQKYSRNIPGMSPKDFEKIYYSEPETLTNEVSGDTCTNTAFPRVDPPENSTENLLFLLSNLLNHFVDLFFRIGYE